jgi:hypothetical protein
MAEGPNGILTPLLGIQILRSRVLHPPITFTHQPDALPEEINPRDEESCRINEDKLHRGQRQPVPNEVGPRSRFSWTFAQPIRLSRDPSASDASAWITGSFSHIDEGITGHPTRT